MNMTKKILLSLAVIAAMAVSTAFAAGAVDGNTMLALGHQLATNAAEGMPYLAAIGMTTLAADLPRAYELGDRNEFPVIAADVIYEGAAVGDNAAGYVRPLVAGDPFRGFAEKLVDNSTGAAGAKSVRVKDVGKIQLPVTGVVITSVGSIVYASDDNTFTLTAGSNSKIGRVVRFVSAGVAVVKFQADQNKDA